MKKLADVGWKLGLRFDPIIPACNFAKIYENLFKKEKAIFLENKIFKKQNEIF